ncbi:putative membrane protein YdfK [Lachnospiraceae bacterium]|nr:putative membrane protein YdfK [Lachnospiraceae bacterium]
MILTGAVVNALAVFAGSAVGLLLKKGFPERMGDSIMKGLSLCVIYIGISGAFEGENVLIAIVSMAGGTVIGELLNLNERMEQLGEWIQNKFQSKDSKVSVAEGFVTSSLLFCTGAMTIVGALQSGLSLDHSTLFAKSLIDGIAAVVLASSLGFGVLFAGIFCLVYEGGLALCAQFIGPFFGI